MSTHHEIPTGLVPTMKLPEELYQHVISLAADVALDTGDVAVAVGMTPDHSLVCADGGGCCLDRPGVIVVVPDVKEAEFVANGEPAPAETRRLVRPSDQRGVAIFKGVAAGS
jgi:hypothetical protein